MDVGEIVGAKEGYSVGPVGFVVGSKDGFCVGDIVGNLDGR